MSANPNVTPSLTITEEQLQAIKAGYLNGLQQIYNQFLQGVAQLPKRAEQAQLANIFLDTGYVWLEKSILLLQPSDLPVTVLTPSPDNSPLAPANDQVMTDNSEPTQDVMPDSVPMAPESNDVPPDAA